jgi:hypothetical protein
MSSISAEPHAMTNGAIAGSVGGSATPRLVACAIVATVVLSIAALCVAQPGPGRTAPPEVFSSSSCRARYQRGVERINAEHRTAAQGCRGNSGCIGAANDRKSAGLQEETQRLLLCQKTEEKSTGAPPPSRATPDPPPDFVKPDVPPPSAGNPPANPPSAPPAAPPYGSTPPTQPPRGSTPPRKPPADPQPPVRATKPGTWSRQGPEWVYTDPSGKPWLFKPSFKDVNDRGSTRLYVLDRDSVKVMRHVRGDLVTARYTSRDPLLGEDSITLDGRLAPGY